MAEHSSHPSSNREAMPHGLYEHDGRLKIVIAGLDQNVRAQAVEAANERLNEELGEGGFTRKFIKGIWKGNVAREYYLAKYTSDAESQIREHENLLQHEGLTAEQYQTATTLRFAHEYDDMLHQGEKRHAVLDQNEDGSHNNEGYALKQRIFRLVEGYAAGKFSSDDDFHEEKKRLITEAVEQGLTKDHIGEGLLYTDNLLQIAQNVKAMVDYRVATGESGNIDEILSNTDIVLGDARLGARTEAELSPTERIMKKLEGKAFVSETTMVTAVSAVYSVGSWATKTAIGAAGRAVALGLGSGVTAALREKRMLKEERAQHAREMALGKGNTERLSGRREALEEARYETKSAKELTEQIGLLYAPEGEFKVTDKATFDEALGMLAESQARIRVSDKKNIDLISFSEVGSVEKERFELDLALAKAKCDLRSFMESATDDELKALGIAAGDIPELRSGTLDMVDFVLTPQADAMEMMLVEGSDDYEGVAQKDRIYAKMRAGRMGKAFLKGTVLGMAIGTAAQEAAAFALDSKQGFVEGALGVDNKDATHDTLLEAAFHTQAPVEVSGEYGAPITGENGTKLMLPEEFHFDRNESGVSLVGPDNMRIDDLKLNADGSLTSESMLNLKQAGFTVDNETYFTSQDIHRETVVSTDAFVDNHKDLTTHVTRDFWYDNGTANDPEGSELGLQRPTLGDNGISYSVSGMEHDATTSSTSGSADWREVANRGELKLAISASQGTQTEVFMVDIDSDGNAVIPKDSPVANLFSERNGEVQFNGKYAEVVEVANTDDDGITHIRPLATDIGEGRPTVTDTIVEKDPQAHHSYTLNYEPNNDRLVSVPPVLPWYPRTGIGRLVRRNREVVNIIDTDPPVDVPERRASYLSSYFDVDTPEERNRYRERMSPRLREGDNPDVELNEDEELVWYWDNQSQEHRDNITELSDSLGPMDKDVDIVVSIPVAGHQEMDNIYRTLEAYNKQTLDKGRFEIVLYVNHPEFDKEGNPTSADETLAEIERFRADYPDMPIKVMYEKLSRENANIAHIRKTLSDTVMRRSMLRPEKNGDLVYVSNDADTIRVSDVYLENFTDRFNQHPEWDAMLGQLDWDNEVYLKYPEVHIGTRLFLYDGIMHRRAGGNIGSSGGNFSMHIKNLAAIGGYNTDVIGAGEDVEIGRALRVAREGSATRQPIGFGGNTQSRLETSARRAVFVLESFDDAPINQWSYSFGADDDEVRRLVTSRQELPNYDDPATRDELVEKTQNMVNRTIHALFGAPNSGFNNVRARMSDDERRFIERSIRFSGIKFEWEPDGSSIRITDADDMFDGLKAFRTQYERRQARREAERASSTSEGSDTSSPITPPVSPSGGRPLGSPVDRLSPSQVFDAYFDFYSGPMRFMGATSDGESYQFEPVDASGNPRPDEDILILDKADADRALRRGNLAPPR